VRVEIKQVKSVRKQNNFWGLHGDTFILLRCNLRSLSSGSHARLKFGDALKLVSLGDNSVLSQGLLLFVLHPHIGYDARFSLGLEDPLLFIHSWPINVKVFQVTLSFLCSVPPPHCDLFAGYSEHLCVKPCLLNRPLSWIALEAILEKLFFFVGQPLVVPSEKGLAPN